MLNTVIEDLHNLAVDLRPASLDRLGLLPALNQYVETFRRQSHTAVVLESAGLEAGERFASEIETTIYRVVQEALTNIAAMRMQVMPAYWSSGEPAGSWQLSKTTVSDLICLPQNTKAGWGYWACVNAPRWWVALSRSRLRRARARPSS